MNYTLHQLYVFLKVAQNKSITKAVELPYATCSFYTLKNFQDQFEFPLTEVIGRKLVCDRFWRRKLPSLPKSFK
jgi:hypothetical protein